jgi:hypothetical protein
MRSNIEQERAMEMQMDYLEDLANEMEMDRTAGSVTRSLQ